MRITRNISFILCLLMISLLMMLSFQSVQAANKSIVLLNAQSIQANQAPVVMDITPGAGLSFSTSSSTKVDIFANGSLYASGIQLKVTSSKITFTITRPFIVGVYDILLINNNQNWSTSFAVKSSEPEAPNNNIQLYEGSSKISTIYEGYTIESLQIKSDPTQFTASTKIYLLDRTRGDDYSSNVISTRYVNTREMAFQLLPGLPVGNYQIYAVTGTAVSSTTLEIKKSSISVSPSTLPNRYQGLQIQITGQGTNFQSFTNIRLYQSNGTEQVSAIQQKNVQNQTLMFIQFNEGLSAGLYKLVVSDGLTSMESQIVISESQTTPGATSPPTTSTPTTPTNPTKPNIPTPTATPTPIKPIVIPTKEKIDSKNVTTEVRVVGQQVEFIVNTLQAINDIKNSTKEIFEIDTSSTKLQEIRTQISSDILKQAISKSQSSQFLIKSHLAQILLPANLFTSANIEKQLGISLPSTWNVIAQMKKANPIETNLVDTLAKNNQMQIVIAPITFDIYIQSGTQSWLWSDFGRQYVSRTFDLLNPESDLSKIVGVTILDNALVSVPTKIYRNANGILQVELMRNGNSSYAIVKNQVSFTDVANSHWAIENIQTMANKLVLKGIGNGKFAPEDRVTRAQFVAITVRALGILPKTYSDYFKDVKSSDWYAKEVQAALQANLISGAKGIAFRPNDPITREEMAIVMVNAMKYTNFSFDAFAFNESTTLAKFKDQSQISNFARSAVTNAVGVEILNGIESTRFAPKEFTTRAQASTVVYRILKKLDMAN
jgi:hypothetical protein